jgi:tetratricopeptide (TPR) repeat protein
MDVGSANSWYHRERSALASLEKAYRLLFTVTLIGLAAAMGLGLYAQGRFEQPQPFGMVDYRAHLDRLRETDRVQALQQLRLAAQINYGGRGDLVVLESWGRLYDDRDSEIFALRKLTLIEPGDKEWHLRLGVALIRSIQEKASQGKAPDEGALREIVAHSELALRIDPGSGRAYRNLGSVSLMRGRGDEAERMFLRALELHPDLSTARQGLELARRMKAR